MPDRRKSSPLSEKKLRKLIEEYSRDALQGPKEAYFEGKGMLWARFERAAGNQCEDGEATIARYALWADTMRDGIVEAMRRFEAGDMEDGNKLLVQAANSLSAFSDVQAYFDPFHVLEKKD